MQKSGDLSEPVLRQFEPWASNKPFGKDDLYTYLEMLDRKLNVVIDLLSTRDHPFHGSYMDVVISGSGLRYASDMRLEEGSLVEIRLVLPFFPKLRIAALGEVARCERLFIEDRETWETAIRFVEINEKDRDVLVRYVFSKERESLRAEQGS